METLNTVFSIIQVVLAVAVIILIALQKSKQGGLSGAITGGSETFFGKNKGNTLDAKLNKMTVIITIVLCVLTLVLNIIK